MPEFFQTTKPSFDLLGEGGWRQPQLGALGAVLRHWSLARPEPTLISIPTGTGKTAIALASPFLASETPRRVLVLAPAQQVRRQLADQFASYVQLIRLGVLPDTLAVPSVYEMTGRATDWAALERYDVVVALPNSISSVYYEEGMLPPSELFDLYRVRDLDGRAGQRTPLAMLRARQHRS